MVYGWGIDEDLLGADVESGRISLTGVEEVAVDNAWIGDDEGEMLLELRLKGRGELEFEPDSREAQRLPAEHRASIEFWGEGMASGRLPVDVEIQTEVEPAREPQYVEVIDLQAQPSGR